MASKLVPMSSRTSWLQRARPVARARAVSTCLFASMPFARASRKALSARSACRGRALEYARRSAYRKYSLILKPSATRSFANISTCCQFPWCAKGLAKEAYATTFGRMPWDRICSKTFVAPSASPAFAQASSTPLKTTTSAGTPASSMAARCLLALATSPTFAQALMIVLKLCALGSTPNSIILLCHFSARSTSPTFAHASIMALKLTTFGSTLAATIFSIHFSARCTSPALAQASTTAV
mmetsp:Transcript_1981/g.4541  ORF Transcript_1981/g.4541 Transcript_1981/m.4541 type:complete len:240 (+) Transcript_1981:173-892(+)